MTKIVGRFDYLDGFRGLACLMVVFCHSAVNIGAGPWVIWGFTGVHLFFVISGFLLATPFLDGLMGKRTFPDIKGFWKRRLIRIYPPFICSLIAFTLLRFATHTNIPTVKNVLIHVFLINNYVSDIDFYSINPVYWTLAVEMQFYALLPLIALFVKHILPPGKSAVRLLILLFFVIGVSTRFLEFSYFQNIGNGIKFKSVFAFLDFFSAGMFIGAWKRGYILNTTTLEKKNTPVFVVALVVLILASRWASVKSNTDWLATPSLAFALLFPILVCGSYALLIFTTAEMQTGFARLIRSRFLIFAGHLSYTIYLYHAGIQQMVLRFIHLESRIADWQTMVFVYSLIHLGPILLCSFILFRLIEKPTLDYLESLKKEEGRAKSAGEH
jgi:peptidoglycan/LPS O-acetylase OafA/YrhL